VNIAGQYWLISIGARGRREGHEWVALNPKRNDRTLGSFKINLKTSRWAENVATGDRGGDPVSLAAYREQDEARSGLPF
jgi:hypothetical protein